MAGDEPVAKQLVEQLIDQMGFDPVDAGPLSAARPFENGGELYGAELTGEAFEAALGHTSRPGLNPPAPAGQPASISAIRVRTSCATTSSGTGHRAATARRRSTS